ncbi:MAG: sulfatase-like hydrolase/transferase [Patescibacteria group bacterium]|jgi:phosphoglycerol transferase MdoB-like AlkP superfamily enzyme
MRRKIEVSLFSNLVVFFALFSLMRIFLIYVNGFQSFINRFDSVWLVLLTGALEDSIVVLIFGALLLLFSFILKKDNSNLIFFKIGLIFIFSLELLILALTFIDTVYFSLARSHLHYTLFAFAIYTANFAASILAFFTWPNLVLLLFFIILFFSSSYCIVTRIKRENLPSIRWRVSIFFIFLLLLVGLLTTIPKIIFTDFFVESISNNFIVYLISTTDSNYCHRSAESQAIEKMEVTDLDQHYFQLNPLAPDFRYFDDNYPLAKAPTSDLCRLGLVTEEECQQDRDNDGYILKFDCDDTKSDIRPGAKEILNNRIDENCDGIDDAKPNVILIFLESFGAKYLSPEITPFFSQLSQDNLSFTNFYSNGTDTTRSIISTLCSLYPQTGPPEINDNLNTDLLCLPQILQQFDYYNIEMQAGDLKFLDKRPFFEKIGFAEVLGKDELGGLNGPAWGITDRALFSQVTEKLDNLDKKPFFLTVYGLAVHHPFYLPEGEPALYPNDTFAHQIFNLLHYSDSVLSDFFDQNKDKDWFKNSIIIITADNSQPIGERIFNFINFISLHEENLWIPLVIVNNGGEKLKGQNDMVSSQIDIAPTILDLLGIKIMNHFQGKDLLANQLNYQDSFMYATSPYLGCMSTYRQGDYKVMKRFYKDVNLLYNLKDGRAEENDVKDQEKNQFNQLDKMVSQLFLYQHYLYKNNRFWSPTLQNYFNQSIKFRQED